jgi:hypothetical protein
MTLKWIHFHHIILHKRSTCIVYIPPHLMLVTETEAYSVINIIN